MEMSAKAVLLDRMLAHFGPESKEARDFLRNSLEGSIDQLWAKRRTGPFGLDVPKSAEDRQNAFPKRMTTPAWQSLGFSMDTPRGMAQRGRLLGTKLVVF